MSPATKKRLLIVKLGAIGDVVMTIPAAYAMHEKGYDIDWLCGEIVAPVLQLYPWINIIAVEERPLLRGTVLERLRATTGIWHKLAGQHYDLCATLYYDRRYAMLTWPVRAERRLMLSRVQRASRLIAGRHHSDEYLRILLEADDICRPERAEPLRPSNLPPCRLPDRRATVRVAIVPGGASNMVRQQILRRWRLSAYVDLTRKLLERGYEVVLLGGPDDVWARAEFAGLAACEALFDRIGTLSLPEVISVCDSCDIVVTHDTGPMHLAGLSQASILGLFGPTNPGDFLPRRRGVRAIWGGEHLACRPCYDGREFAPCRNNECMQQITLPMVLQQMDALLAERSLGDLSSQFVVLPSNRKAVSV